MANVTDTKANITNFDLQNVDMAYAISQNNLNSALYEYLNGHGATVQFAFDLVDGTTLQPVAYTTDADMVFNGVLSAPLDGTTPVLDLSQSGAANQVGFNVTFASATFVLGPNLDNKTYTQGATQWVLPLLGQLSQINLQSMEGQPQWLQDEVSGLNGSYGDIFDINQVLIDLSNLVVNSNLQVTYTPPEFKTFSGGGDWGWLLRCMAAYIQANPAAVFPALPAAGTAATAKQTGGSTPTYAPTSAAFVIVPNTTTPNHSALVWALMTENDTLPQTPADSFTNVSFFNDDTTTGYAIIGATKFLSFLQGELVASTDGFGANQYIEAVQSTGSSWIAATLSNCPAPTKVQPTTAAPGVAQWVMPQQKSEGVYFDAIARATGDSDVTVQFAANNLSNGCYNQLNLTGTVQFVASWYANKGAVDWQSPTFKYPWLAGFSIEQAGSAAGVGFVYNPATWSFPTDPIIDDSTAYQWDTASSDQRTLLNNVLSNPVAALSANLQKGVSAGLPAMGAFVFGGGGTFTFQAPVANSAFALVATLQYQNQG